MAYVVTKVLYCLSYVYEKINFLDYFVVKFRLTNSLKIIPQRQKILNTRNWRLVVVIIIIVGIIIFICVPKSNTIHKTD